MYIICPHFWKIYPDLPYPFKHDPGHYQSVDQLACLKNSQYASSYLFLRQKWDEKDRLSVELFCSYIPMTSLDQDLLHDY